MTPPEPRAARTEPRSAALPGEEADRTTEPSRSVDTQQGPEWPGAVPIRGQADDTSSHAEPSDGAGSPEGGEPTGALADEINGRAEPSQRVESPEGGEPTGALADEINGRAERSQRVESPEGGEPTGALAELHGPAPIRGEDDGANGRAEASDERAQQSEGDEREDGWAGQRAAAKRIAQRLLAKPASEGATKIVAIDGQSGAGKTTFAAALAKAIEAQGASASVVHTDDLLDGWDDQFTFWERLREQVIDPILQGHRAAYRRYDWIRERFDDELTPVRPADVLIVEGVSAAREDMRRIAELSVFLQVTEEEAWRRLRARDPEEAMPFLVAWKAREGRHFAGDHTPEQVDVVIDEDVPPTGA